MQVKKFEGASMQDALDKVKKELGPEAVILQTKKKGGLGVFSKASVEITAAVSERSIQKKQWVENRLSDSKKGFLQKLSAEKQATLHEKYTEKRGNVGRYTPPNSDASNRNRKITATRYAEIQDDVPPQRESSLHLPKIPTPAAIQAQIDKVILSRTEKKQAQETTREVEKNLQEELQELRGIVQELKRDREKNQTEQGANQAWSGYALNHPSIQDVFEQLVLNNVDRRYAYQLVKHVLFENGSERCRDTNFVFDRVAAEMMDSIDVAKVLPEEPAFTDYSQEGTREHHQPQILTVVGPTGVGKTATLAKIAGRAVQDKKLKVGLINLDNEKEYAFDQLGTYARVLNLPFRSASTLSDLRQAVEEFKRMDLILVDTPGGLSLEHELGRFRSSLEEVGRVKTAIVLSLTTRDLDCYETIERYRNLRLDGVIMSKLDDTKVYGTLYNISQKSGLPFYFFTTGQKIPDDLEQASVERIASLVLRID